MNKKQLKINKSPAIFIVNKKLGETPLQALDRLRARRRSLKEVPLTYAGRLDPMASGLLLVLAGDECKKKNNYLSLDKIYEFEVLFGFSTDSYDILGLIKSTLARLPPLNTKIIKKVVRRLRALKKLPYPPFSSKTISGMPLWRITRNNLDNSIKPPERAMRVFSIDFLGLTNISRAKLLRTILFRISKVSGDFRQREVLEAWQSEIAKADFRHLPIARFRVHCSSGTYVRALVHFMEDQLSVPALTFSIKRTAIGSYCLNDLLKRRPGT